MMTRSLEDTFASEVAFQDNLCLDRFAFVFPMLLHKFLDSWPMMTTLTKGSVSYLMMDTLAVGTFWVDQLYPCTHQLQHRHDSDLIFSFQSSDRAIKLRSTLAFTSSTTFEQTSCHMCDYKLTIRTSFATSISFQLQHTEQSKSKVSFSTSLWNGMN